MEKLPKFEKIILFSVLAENASAKEMVFYTDTGRSFLVDCTDKSQYKDLLTAYPALKECVWGEPAMSLLEIMQYGKDGKNIVLPKGFWRIGLNKGQHLVIKEELHYAVREELLMGKERDKIFPHWVEYLNEVDFPSRITDIRAAYYKQKERDEVITKQIKEANKSPEYRKQVLACKSNAEMMDICMQYGIEITDPFELKQIGMRQMGLV